MLYLLSGLNNTGKTEAMKEMMRNLTNCGISYTHWNPADVHVNNKKHDFLDFTITTKCFFIEHPETFLHPSNQSKFGFKLAELALTTEVFVETHSEHILNAIRIACKQGKLDSKLVCITYHTFDEIIEISMDQDGDLSKWPEDFFDQWDKSLMQLLS